MFTQYGHHHVVAGDLDGAPGQEVDGGEDVSEVDERVGWWGVHGLEAHGQGAEACLAAPPECLAVL